MGNNRQHLPPDDGGIKPVTPPPKPSDARRAVIVEGCADCPHPDYCAGMGECERTAAQPHEFVGRLDRWCEVCNRPDRDPIHKRISIESRIVMRRNIKFARGVPRNKMVAVTADELEALLDAYESGGFRTNEPATT